MNRFEKLREKYLYRYCGYWGRVNLRKHVRRMDSVSDALLDHRIETNETESEDRLDMLWYRNFYS